MAIDEIQTIVGNGEATLPPGVVKTKNNAYYDTNTNKFVPNPFKPAKEKTVSVTSPADDGKGKPGRKPLPRDADGNIIRPDAPKVEAPKEDKIGDRPSKRKESSKRVDYSASQTELLAKQTVGVHAMFALMTGTPELQITETEGMILAKAITAIASEYGVAVSGKAAAGMQMLAACAMVYAPRAIKIAARVNAQNKSKPGVSKVTPIRPDLNQQAHVQSQPGAVTIPPHEFGADIVNENAPPMDELMP